MLRQTLGRIRSSVNVKSVRQSSSFTLSRVFTPLDLKRYAEISGDYNPIHLHDDNPIVHGTLLLGVISGIMGTQCPGPGSRVKVISSRKIMECQFNASDKSNGDVLVQGEAKLRKGATPKPIHY